MELQAFLRANKPLKTKEKYRKLIFFVIWKFADELIKCNSFKA